MPYDGTIPEAGRFPLSQIREQLRHISQNQENLNDAREELLVERSAVQSRGKRLRAQRIRTRNAEAAFMTAARDFYKEAGCAFPLALSAAYETVKAEDDKLGTMEVEYSEKEEALGGKEWEFSEQETSFYQYDLQELIGRTLTYEHDYDGKQAPQTDANTTLPLLLFCQFQETVSRHGQLMRRFNALRDRQAGLLETRDDLTLESPYVRFFDEYSQILSDIMDCDVKIGQLKQELMRHGIPAPMILSPGSAASLDWEKLQKQMPPNSLLDGSVPNSLYGFPISSRVPEWLLSCMKGSALERRSFLNILEERLGLPEGSQTQYDWWDDCVTRLWLSDSSAHFIQPEEDLRSPTEESGQYKDVKIDRTLGVEPIRQQEHVEPLRLLVPSHPSCTTSDIVFVNAVPQRHPSRQGESVERRALHEPPRAFSQKHVQEEELIRQHAAKSKNNHTASEMSAGERRVLPTIRVELRPDEPSAAGEFGRQSQIGMDECGLMDDPQQTPISPTSPIDISVYPASNSGLLRVPLAPRYDSCQESDNEEAQMMCRAQSRVNELCAEPAATTEAVAIGRKTAVTSAEPHDASRREDTSKGTAHTPEDCSGLRRPAPEPLLVCKPAILQAPTVADRGIIKIDALIKQRQHQIKGRKCLSPQQLATPINRPKSVSETPTRAREPHGQLQVPLQQQHRRSKSDNLIHFNREEFWKGVTSVSLRYTHCLCK
ncbi:uncharacterized protein EI97DRAFT_188260 [Westerdykella ornata]|uniref:Uncharacterized protein n=1 Tax=Westerdykella ornata TaxID=318751 RepID=A0A6A6JXN0_WESOR|nr:uncharacterized protein EI97DRAFT_188260 [Westerdykella ornata]KAF2279829.1 hypothetical protein EI97DRAFT_188260 [Westerdykella ornata]